MLFKNFIIIMGRYVLGLRSDSVNPFATFEYYLIFKSAFIDSEMTETVIII